MKELSIKEKELLVKDLSSRLPYGVVCQFYHAEFSLDDEEPFAIHYNEKLSSASNSFIGSFNHNIDKIRPYLRPMSSMTKEEKAMYEGLMIGTDNISYMLDVIDWLNAHHFDYRGLIPMNLALEAPKGMYKID